MGSVITRVRSPGIYLFTEKIPPELLWKIISHADGLTFYVFAGLTCKYLRAYIKKTHHTSVKTKQVEKYANLFFFRSSNDGQVHKHQPTRTQDMNSYNKINCIFGKDICTQLTSIESNYTKFNYKNRFHYSMWSLYIFLRDLGYFDFKICHVIVLTTMFYYNQPLAKIQTLYTINSLGEFNNLHMKFRTFDNDITNKITTFSREAKEIKMKKLKDKECSSECYEYMKLTIQCETITNSEVLLERINTHRMHSCLCQLITQSAFYTYYYLTLKYSKDFDDLASETKDLFAFKPQSKPSFATLFENYLDNK